MASYQTLVASTALTFDDEFNSFVSSPNGGVGWMTSYQYRGEAARNLSTNDEEQYYSDSSVGTNPFSDANGILGITASVAVPGSNPYGLPYTSGLITTFRSFAQLYGYFEMSAELPAGKGLWPAFFLLSANGGDTSELDVFEDLGGSPDALHLTAHGPNGTQTSVVVNVPTATTAFNTYGVDWEPTTITFYIDGVAVASMATPANMDTPMYMLADLAVGGPSWWGGPPTSNAIFPATMQINYVRAYASASTVDVSGPDAIRTASVSGQVLVAGIGQAGVVVALRNAAGTVVATMTTGVSGAYSFSGLAAGTYQVRFTPPPGLTLVSGSEANAASGLTPTFTLSDGAALSLPVEALKPPDPGTVQASVLYFSSATAPGIADAEVTVSLLNAAGGVIATSVSGIGGAVTFGNVVAGTYQLKYTAPAGQIIGPGGNANTATGLTAQFAVAAGQTVTAPSVAMVPPAVIAGTVLLAGAAESGVAVSLLSAAAKVLATTTTNSTGGFSFTGLAAGSYEVKYTAPSGQVFQTGSEANAATGITPVVTLAANQALTLPAEQLLSSPGTISVVVDHYGAPTDNPWGSGEGGVTVSLLNAAGAVIATVVSSSSVISNFRQIGPGTYQLKYTAPSGQGFKPGGPENPATGLTAQFTVAAGQTVNAPIGELISTIVMNGTNLTQVAPAGGYLVTGNAGNSTLTLGNGNQYVTLTGGGDSVTTGTGNQTITLSGNNNTVTVGNGSDTITLTGTGNTVIDTGTSSSGTINAGSGGDRVHVTGGTDNITINAAGAGNLFDAGPGLNFLNADGSSGNVFMLNAAAANYISLTTITGFNPAAGDILDLKRTLAGTDILPNLSNVASLVTGSFSGANTDLWAAPAGGGKPLPFAVLDGVHVTVAQLLAAKEFSLS